MSDNRGFFSIDRQLPSLNQYTSANRTNKYKGAQFKKEQEEYICWCIKIALARGDLQCFDEPVEVYIDWHEKDKKRDCDNIQSSQKFILDAMQKMGVIPNDNRKYVKQVHHKIFDTKGKSYVIVRIVKERPVFCLKTFNLPKRNEVGG